VDVARWWLLIPVLLVSVWFGARGLDADPIWQDEYFQVRDVRTSNDPLALAVHIAAANPWHVPSYFIVLNGWGRLFDWNPVPMRAMALFMGMLAIAWTYRLGQDFISRRVGVYAAVILGVSAFFVYYWHELRMYTMNVLAAALVLWFYLRLIRQQREPGWGSFAALAVSMFVAFYTHYFLAVLLASIGIYHLLFVRKNRRWWKVTAAIALAGISFLPWLNVFLKTSRAVARETFGGYLDAGGALRELSFVFSNGQIWLLLALLLLSLLAVWAWRGRARRNLAMLWFVLTATLTIVLVANQFMKFLPAERLRYVILIWAPLAVIVAAGMAQVGVILSKTGTPGRWLPLAALALWGGIGVWNNLTILEPGNLIGYQPYYPMQKAFRVVRALHSPGDFLVHLIPDNDDSDRYRRAIDFYPENALLAADSEVLGMIHVGQPAPDERRQSILGAMGRDRAYVWVAYPSSPIPSIRADFEAELGAMYAMCGTVVRRPDFSIDEFAASPACCTPDAVDRPPLIVYGDGLELRDIDLQADAAAETLNLHAAFRGGDRLPPDTYSVATHVLNANGDLVAQADYGLPSADFQCTSRALSLAGLPPGTYEMRVAVYNWQTGERLPGVVTASGARGDLLPVGTFDLAGD